MTGDPSRWHVVQTQAHAEAKAASHLLRQGYSVYLPRYLKRRRHARRIEIVSEPLFPRYLFVAIDRTTQRWRAIHSTVGVTRLVSQGDDPARVTDAVISELHDREDAQGYVRLDIRPRFRPGEKVRVVNGVFGACLGLFEGMADQERVAILLDLLGRKVRVVVDGAAIDAA